VIFSTEKLWCQQSCHQNDGLPDNGTVPILENDLNQDLDDHNPYRDEHQLVSEGSNDDASMEQTNIETKLDRHWVTHLATLPNAWLLFVVLFHLSTWRWMNLLG
jgi:hypothetical protein